MAYDYELWSEGQDDNGNKKRGRIKSTGNGGSGGSGGGYGTGDSEPYDSKYRKDCESVRNNGGQAGPRGSYNNPNHNSNRVRKEHSSNRNVGRSR